MDELKNTPETTESNQAPKAQTAQSVSLSELLKWADQAIDSLEKPKKQPIEEQAAPAPETEHAPDAAPHAEPASDASDAAEAQAPGESDTSAEPSSDPQPEDGASARPEDPESSCHAEPVEKSAPANKEKSSDDYDDDDDVDYNDDELLRGYIWDEETGKLYRVKEKDKHPVLIPIFLAAIALIAIAASVLRKAPLLPPTKAPDNSILAEEQQIEQQETVLPAEQQQADQVPAVQYIPAEIISDGKLIAVMASTEATYALLEDVKAYFHDSVTGDGEKETVFEDPVEVLPLPNGTSEQISSYDELFALFTSSASPLKVRTTLTAVESEILPFDTETEDHPTLIEGTRIVASLGREGSETTRTYTVYINGDRSTSRSGSDTETIKPMDMLIYEGEEKLDPDEDSPGRHEGERGPDQGELTFIDPIEGDISCNFGQLYGVLHLGLDYEPEDNNVLASEAGTVVTLMERGGYGLVLEIDHGNGFVTRYAHLHSASVAIGDTVEQGQVIAIAGRTGNVEETTLHFEIRVDGLAYNPRYYLD